MSCQEHMVTAPATVLQIAPGRVLLDIARQSACKACAEKAQCGSQQETTRGQKMWLATETPLTAGETVAVTVSETAVWHAASLAYGLPLAGFVTGLLAGALLGDIPALFGALTGLTFGFIGGGVLARKSRPAMKILTGRASERQAKLPIAKEAS